MRFYFDLCIIKKRIVGRLRVSRTARTDGQAEAILIQNAPEPDCETVKVLLLLDDWVWLAAPVMVKT